MSVSRQFHFPTSIPPTKNINLPLYIEKLILYKNIIKLFFFRFQHIFHINIQKRVQKIWLWSFSSKFEENRNFGNVFHTVWIWVVIKSWNSRSTMLDLHSTSPENFVKIRWKFFEILQNICLGCIISLKYGHK